MNILYICGDDPTKTGCGTQIRTHLLWEVLKRIGTVHVFVPPRGRKLGFFANLFRGFTKVGKLPCLSAKAARRAVGFDGVNFDAVVVRYVNLAAEFCAWKIAPCYIDVDDVPIHAFQLEKTRLPQGIRWLAALTVRCWQRAIFKKCRGVWIVKDEDRRFLPRKLLFAILKNLALEPSIWPRLDVKREKLLMTVGLMGYGPNVDGVMWFLREVWPQFHKQHPEWRYSIAGRGAPERLVRACESADGVELLGFVEDLDALYARSAAVVAPITSGAGSCVKVIESALRGRSTFVTPFAARGINGDDAEKLGFSAFDSYQTFEDAFGCWLSLSDGERQMRERSIRECAKDYNSSERFTEAVKRVLA